MRGIDFGRVHIDHITGRHSVFLCIFLGEIIINAIDPELNLMDPVYVLTQKYITIFSSVLIVMNRKLSFREV